MAFELVESIELPDSQHERMLMLRNILLSRATGGNSRDAEFAKLREWLKESSALWDRMPSWFRTLWTLDDFWTFIKSESGHYEPRREFIRSALDPIVTQLETEPVRLVHDVLEDGAGRAFVVMDSDHVSDAYCKMLSRVNADPEGAISAARSLLETVCKHILHECGDERADSYKLNELYNTVATKMNLSPKAHAEKHFKKILNGCNSVVDGLGSIRNFYGDSHGKRTGAPKPLPRHARLVVVLASGMATFLIETWDDQQDPCT